MSADRFDFCPICEKSFQEKIGEINQKISELHNAQSFENEYQIKFLVGQKASLKKEHKAQGETVRAYTTLRMDNGLIDISYDGECQECFSTFNYQSEIEPIIVKR